MDERERLSKIFEENPLLMAAIADAIGRQAWDSISSCWEQVFTQHQRWFALAERPREFDRELNKIFSQLRRYVKQLYGIKSHRPSRNSARDLKVWNLRQQYPTWTVGQIAKEVRMTPGAVAEALNRQKRRRQRENAGCGLFLELLADALKEASRRSGQQPDTKLMKLIEGPVN